MSIVGTPEHKTDEETSIEVGRKHCKKKRGKDLSVIFVTIVNRPSVAGVFLQTPLSLSQSVTHSL